MRQSLATTAIGLQPRHRWISPKERRREQSTVVVHSSFTVQQQSFFNDTIPFNLEFPTRNAPLADQWQTTAALDQAADTNKEEKEKHSKTTKAATITSSTMNLIKVVLGTGVLALPNGLAAVSDYPIA